MEGVLSDEGLLSSSTNFSNPSTTQKAIKLKKKKKTEGNVKMEYNGPKMKESGQFH
jgi:hypothetical protein